MTAADDVAWADEAARVELRTAIEALEASARR
jgi:hypothetical protein